MSAYLTPGVYRRPQPQEAADLRRVRTDVAGFVGFAERGPLPPPGATEPAEAAAAVVRLTSWPEFVATFGGYVRQGYLAYAVRAFFDNGGTTCHVVRVAAIRHSDPAQRPAVARYALPAGPALPLTAVLAAPAASGARQIELTAPPGIGPGSLLELTHVEGGALRAVAWAVVTGVQGTTVELAAPLPAAFPAGITLASPAPALRVRARSAGGWGNRVRLAVSPLESGEAVAQFALRVRVEAGPDRTRAVEEEFYNRLSLDPQSLYWAPDVVNRLSRLIEVEVDAPRLLVAGGPLSQGAVHLQGGRDGLSGVVLEDFTGGLADFRGLRLLEDVDEVAILCVPDAVFEKPPPAPPRPQRPPDPCAPPPEPSGPPAPDLTDPTAETPALSDDDRERIQQTAVEQCERLYDRVAILDPPRQSTPLEAVAWRRRFTTRFGALYYPWVEVADPLAAEGPRRQVPPSGHVAGLYARIDNRFGVERPPANAPLEFAADLVEEIDDRGQEGLNPFGVNALRSFPGRGIRVWGARSLAGKDDADWRFIHVRRVMSMIEESVDEATQWAVFEVNDEALRRSLQHSLSVFLETIWRRGGLKGNRPEEGFYVKCDETNNPRHVIDAGQLICEVGVAVAAPMEFLVFELRQTPTGARITER